MYIGLHVKYRLLLSDLKKNFNFVDTVSKNTQISNLIKLHPVGAGLLHTDGRRDRHDEANSRF
jgi:hypothetical protein